MEPSPVVIATRLVFSRDFPDSATFLNFNNDVIGVMGVRRGSWGTVLDRPSPSPNNVYLELPKHGGVQVLVRFDYLEPWRKCLKCECCSGIYYCTEADVDFCSEDRHEDRPCCQFRPEFGAGLHLPPNGGRTQFLPGTRVRIRAFSDPRRSDGMPTHAIPVDGAVGTVRMDGYPRAEVEFDGFLAPFLCLVTGLEVLRADRPDSDSFALNQCRKWAEEKFGDLGLCWTCQMAAIENELRIGVEPEPGDEESSRRTFRVAAMCRKGHMGRILEQGLDRGKFG